MRRREAPVVAIAVAGADAWSARRDDVIGADAGRRRLPAPGWVLMRITTFRGAQIVVSAGRETRLCS